MNTLTCVWRNFCLIWKVYRKRKLLSVSFPVITLRDVIILTHNPFTTALNKKKTVYVLELAVSIKAKGGHS